jgi:hypothetical protein
MTVATLAEISKTPAGRKSRLQIARKDSATASDPSSITLTATATAANASTITLTAALGVNLHVGLELDFVTNRDVTVSAIAAINATQFDITPALDYPRKAGETLVLTGAKTVILSEDAGVGATTLKCQPLTAALAVNDTVAIPSTQRVTLKEKAAIGSTTLKLDQPLKYSLEANNTATWYKQLIRLRGLQQAPWADNDATNSTVEPVDYESVDGVVNFAYPEGSGKAPTIAASGKYRPHDPGYRVIVEQANVLGYVYYRLEIPDADGNAAEIYEGTALVSGNNRTNPADGKSSVAYQLSSYGEHAYTYNALA